MTIARKTALAIAAAAVVSLLSLGPASAAQAVTITGSSTAEYTNDSTPTLFFDHATPGDIVTINVVSTLPTVYGQVTVDSSGAGSVTATTPLPTRVGLQVVELREYHPGDLVHPVNGDVEYLYVDLVPQLDSGSVHDGDTVDASAVSFDAQTDVPSGGYINGWRIALNVSQQGGPATATAEQTVNGSGGVNGLAPAEPLAAGQYTATARTIDTSSGRNNLQANLPSDPSNAVSFFVAPAQPTVTGLGGQAAREGENVNQSAPSVTVSGVLAGAQVKLFTYDPDTGQPMLVGVGTAAGAGQLTVQTAGLPDGGVRLWATQTVDENGTPVSSDGSADPHSPTSWPTSMFDIDVDTGMPNVASPEINSGDATTNTQPPFYITGAQPNLPGNGSSSGVHFVLRRGGVTVADSGFILSDSQGRALWTPPAALPDGTYTVSPVTVDDTGYVNSTAPSNPFTFTVDTTAPAAPAVASPADAGTVTTSQPTITVRTEPGAHVRLDVDQAAWYDQTADASGTATFTLNGPLTDGQHSLMVFASDKANNNSPETDQTFTVSTAGGTTPQPPPAQQPPAQQPSVQQPPTQQPPTHPQPPAIKQPPALSSHTLTAAKPVKVAVKLTAPGTVTLQLTAKVRGKTRVVGTVTIKAPKGTATYTLTRRFAGHTLAKGAYTLTLKAAGGRSASAALNVR